MAGKSDKYYWLRLKDDFFSSKRIKKLRKLAGGDTYVIIYLKMQLIAMKNDGIIQYTGLEKSFSEELSLDIDEDVDNVQVTLSYLISTGLAETSDNINFFFPYAVENVGSESSSAARVRALRARQKEQAPALQCNGEALHCNNNVHECNTEIERDIEIEIEKEKESDIEKDTEKEEGTLSKESVCRPEDVRQVFDAWQTLGIQKLRKIPDSTVNTGKMLRARIKEYGVGSVLEAVEIVRGSDFLMGRVKDFQITLDWFVRPNNFQKIINGTYDNREKPEQNSRHSREMQQTYNTIERWADQRADDSETV